MRLHTNLTSADIYEAARTAGVDLDKAEAHGSRKRDRAFEVKLTGNSRRRPNGGNYGAGDAYAATWDQWGIFLAVLFARDPALTCWAYDGAEAFGYATNWRFESLTLANSHGDHTFRYAGTPREYKCTKCDAIQRSA